MPSLTYIFQNIDMSVGYIMILLVYISFALLSKLYKNKKFLLISLLIIILISGTRSIVNDDLRNYKMMYENYTSLRLSQIEPGFIFLSYALNQVTSNVHLLFFVYSALEIFFVYLAIKNFTSRVEFSFFLYLTIPSLFLASLIGIRQSLAMAISFYALSLLHKNHRLKYFIFSIIAICFHYTAFLFFLISIFTFLIFKKRINFLPVLILIVITLFIYFTDIDFLILKFILTNINQFLPLKYQGYIYPLLTNTSPLKGFSTLSILIFNILLLTVLFVVNYPYIFKYKKHKFIDNFTKYNFIINLLIIGTFINNLFGSFADVTARIYYYFIFIYIILIPELFCKIKKEDRILVAYVLSAIMIIWFFSGVYDQLPNSNIPPLIYKNYFLNGDFY